MLLNTYGITWVEIFILENAINMGRSVLSFIKFKFKYPIDC